MIVCRLMVCARNPEPTGTHDTIVYAFHDFPAEAIEVRKWPKVFELIGMFATLITEHLQETAPVPVASMHWYLDKYDTRWEFPNNYRTVT